MLYAQVYRHNDLRKDDNINLIPIGTILKVDKVDMDRYHTDIFIKGQKYNSVFFYFFEDENCKEKINIYGDERYNPYIKKVENTMIEKGENTMTKKDLKNGMIVELRNGTRYLYCEGVMRGLNAWDLISNYTDNLKCTEFPPLDIVKVYEDKKEYDLSTIFEYQYLKLIWKRPETPKLSEREIEILKALDVMGFTHIARDRNSDIFAYYDEPKKLRNFSSWGIGGGFWFFNGSVHPDETQSIKLKRDLFSFVDWKDKEPTSIQELLSDFEKGEER